MRARSVLCLVGGGSLLLGLLASPASAEPERPVSHRFARVGSRVGRRWVRQVEIASTPAFVVEVAVDSLAMALRLLRTAGLRTERGLSRADKERPLGISHTCVTYPPWPYHPIQFLQSTSKPLSRRQSIAVSSPHHRYRRGQNLVTTEWLR